MRAVKLLLSMLGLCLAGAPLAAQWRAGDTDYSKHNMEYDGRFTFVRVRYEPAPDWGFRGRIWGDRDLKWDHDYARAEQHLVRILSELTAIDPNTRGSNILTVDDPELFKYPIAYLVEPGFWTLSEEEAASLRSYLLKGGFLILDDFVDRQWFNFEERIHDVLPDARLARLDASHQIFHAFFDIDALDQHHPYWGQQAEYYGIYEDNDPDKRLMVIVNFNNDIGESWEWSDTGFIPIELSNEAYKLGVNYIVYALTH